MKLPSPRFLAKESFETLTRFPLSILCSVIGTAAWILILNEPYRLMSSMEFLYNTAAVGFLGISLGTAIVCFTERKQWSFGNTLIIQIVAGGLLFLYYYSLPTDIFSSPQIDIIRFFLFSAGMHFLVAFAAFIGEGSIGGFWEFNKTLFIRFLTSSVYTIVLFAGLAIALAAVQNLFNIDFASKRYFQLWAFLCGVFNTWFFLNGVPKNFSELDSNLSYPKGLKVFTQYILLPLVIIYFIILYAYFGKIVTEWDWPKGWVGYLVLGFSVTGILSLLLVHPIKDAIENSWIRTVSRWFYVALPPLVILLLLAAWRRISEYGLTENRYFLVILGIWLFAISVYFMFSKTKNIKAIPVSLFFLSILTSFGPWSAFSVSENNQFSRLEGLLTKNGMLVDGKIQQPSMDIPFEDAKNMNSIVRYFCGVHSASRMQAWFDVSLDSLQDNSSPRYTYRNRHDQAEKIVKLMGISSIPDWQTTPSVISGYSFSAQEEATIDISGYQFLMKSIALNSADSVKTFRINNKDWNVTLSSINQTIMVGSFDSQEPAVTLDMKPMIKGILERDKDYGGFAGRNVPAELMVIEQEQQNMKVKILFRTMQYHPESGPRSLNSLQCDLLLSSGARE